MVWLVSFGFSFKQWIHLALIDPFDSVSWPHSSLTLFLSNMPWPILNISIIFLSGAWSLRPLLCPLAIPWPVTFRLFVIHPILYSVGVWQFSLNQIGIILPIFIITSTGGPCLIKNRNYSADLYIVLHIDMMSMFMSRFYLIEEIKATTLYRIAHSKR